MERTDTIRDNDYQSAVPWKWSDRMKVHEERPFANAVVELSRLVANKAAKNVIAAPTR